MFTSALTQNQLISVIAVPALIVVLIILIIMLVFFKPKTDALARCQYYLSLAANKKSLDTEKQVKDAMNLIAKAQFALEGAVPLSPYDLAPAVSSIGSARSTVTAMYNAKDFSPRYAAVVKDSIEDAREYLEVYTGVSKTQSKASLASFKLESRISAARSYLKKLDDKKSEGDLTDDETDKTQD